MFSDLLSPWIEAWPAWLQVVAALSTIAVLILARYVLIAGAGFAVSVLVGRIAPWRRLQNAPFTRAQIQREIGYSVLSILVFMAVIGGIYVMHQAGWTQLYRDMDAYGWTWFWLQIPVVLLIQDWYFYWMHRSIHMAPFYERVHKSHHLSTNPSAFSAFAFHPLEALSEIAIFVLLIITIPLHVTAVLAAGILSLVYNVYGHLGYEIMPRFIAKSPLGYWLNKSAYHNQHHRTYRYNYGLYTVIWDRIHGTMHPHAERMFDEKTEKPLHNEGDDRSSKDLAANK